MSHPQHPDRLRAILAQLLESEITESLAEVERALLEWRAGDASAFEAHAEILRHVGRTELAAEQVGGTDVEIPGLLRRAFDRGVIGEDEFVELVGKSPDQVEPAPSATEAGDGLPPKPDVVEDLLGQGPVLVHVDARAGGVSVPESFTSESRLVLRFGYELSPPIADLDIGEEALAGTLTFGGVPFRCVLPWTAVYAVVGEADQKGMVWPDDVPVAILDDLSAGATAGQDPDVEPGAHGMPSRDEVKRGTHLKLVK